jgi:hypothetical protein
MLKRIVPTPAHVVPVARVLALKEKTSLSGSRHGTTPFQQRPSESRQAAPSHFTMTLVSGAGSPFTLLVGPGTPPGAPAPQLVPPPWPKPFGTWVSLTDVVRLPEWKAAT